MSKSIIRYVDEQIGQPVPIITGTPDHWKIRKAEREIYGEPLTPYPGDQWNDNWDQDFHWKHHSYISTFSMPGCMWCEDTRRESEMISAERAKPAKVRRKIPFAVKAAAVGFGVWLGIMSFMTLVIWILT